jgi:hypothetical protein
MATIYCINDAKQHRHESLVKPQPQTLSLSRTLSAPPSLEAPNTIATRASDTTAATVLLKGPSLPRLQEAAAALLLKGVSVACLPLSLALPLSLSRMLSLSRTPPSRGCP